MRRFSPARMTSGLQRMADPNRRTALGFRACGRRNSNLRQIALRSNGTSANNS
jgi:hypothetical protein